MHRQGGLPDADLVRTALGATTPDERKAAFAAIADKHRQDVLRQCASWYPDPDTAQDVGQTAFEAAFTLLAEGKGPAVPDRLGGWLIEIARRRGQEYIRKRRPAGVYWADLPEGRGLDETEDDDESRSGSASRRAHVTRLVDRVVATLTEQQQEIYRLRFVEELTGREAAARLGISDKAASNEATNVQKLIADGFGALILMQEGRTYCPDLARILDDAAATRANAVAGSAFAAPPDTNVFTAVLRQRIVNHFNECNICDNCRTCDDKRRQLVGPYAPALIPILFAAEFRDRIDETIRRVVEQARAGHDSPSRINSGPPTIAAAGGVPVVAGGLLATAGAGTGAGAAEALVSRLQSVVHKASESDHLPHWLRRAIPRHPGPGASVAVAAAALAAVVVVIVLIATVATALTSGGGSNAGGAGAGYTGPCVSVDSGVGMEGTAVPASAASVATSVQQQVAACRGGGTTPLSDVSATCDETNSLVAQAPYQDRGKVYVYRCTVNATGAIVAQFSSLPWAFDVTQEAKNGSWEQGDYYG